MSASLTVNNYGFMYQRLYPTLLLVLHNTGIGIRPLIDDDGFDFYVVFLKKTSA